MDCGLHNATLSGNLIKMDTSAHSLQCSDLNEKGPLLAWAFEHTVTCLVVVFGKAVESLGGGTMLTEVCHWRIGFEIL